MKDTYDAFTCPRNFTLDQMIAGFKSGRVLVVDRKDAPELAELLELQRQGLVESKFIVYSDQSSAVKF